MACMKMKGLSRHSRVYSGSEFPGLKTAVFDHFEQIWMLIKGIPPLYIGLLSPQIRTDLRGVKNPWKIGGNPPIGGKEYTLPSCTFIIYFSLVLQILYMDFPD